MTSSAAKKPEQWSEAEAKNVKDFWLANLYAGARDQLAPLEAEKAPFAQEKDRIEKATPITFVMADLPQARESFVMERGAYDKPGEKVSRGVPSFLPPLPAKPADRDYNRLDFANWLVSGKHPLTARVTVNRFWQQFFGVGLVKTSMDFGSQGEPPSHPELLDWLAVTFVEDGWDMKKLGETPRHEPCLPAAFGSGARTAAARSGKPPSRPRSAFPPRRRSLARSNPLPQRPARFEDGWKRA